MEPLQPIMKNINERITHFTMAKIVPINPEKSGIWLHEKLLQTWDTTRIGNTNEVLTVNEQGQILLHNSNAFNECATKASEGKISLSSIIAMEPILRSDNRRSLVIKIGLGYDWSHILDLADQKKYDYVQLICARDMFLIDTLTYWCRVNNMFLKKSGKSLISKNAPHMQYLYENIMIVKNSEELIFPISSNVFREYELVSSNELKNLIDNDINKIEKTVNKVKLNGNYIVR